MNPVAFYKQTTLTPRVFNASSSVNLEYSSIPKRRHAFIAAEGFLPSRVTEHVAVRRPRNAPDQKRPKEFYEWYQLSLRYHSKQFEENAATSNQPQSRPYPYGF